MCKITNEFSENLFKELRAYEKEDLKGELKKTELLAKVTYMIKNLENYEEQLKNEITLSSGKIVYIPEVEQKVYLAEGKESISFDKEKVFKILGKEKYLEISSVLKGQLEPVLGRDLANKVIAESSTSHFGEALISVRKMTKQDHIDYKKLQENSK